MALNLSKVTEVSSIPARVRGASTDSEREEVYKEFFQLIDMAKAASKGMVSVRIEGQAECNKYTNALAAFKVAHPTSWACLSTAGGVYEAGKQLEISLYAAARPMERKLAKLAK